MLQRGSRQIVAVCEKSINAAATGSQQRRTLMMQEHWGMNILRDNNINVPPFGVARTPQEAFEHAKQIGGDDFVVKAQVLAGGRGKGRFTSGLQGGVQIVFTPEQVQANAAQMIGNSLVTKQTDARGRPCNEVMVCKRLYLRREYYFGITLDRESVGPVLIGSGKGGMNIEEVAAEDPDAIIKVPVDIEKGVDRETAKKLAYDMGITFEDRNEQAADQILRLYDVFMKHDATLLEINPMAEEVSGTVLCMDCKLVVDDSAVFRQKELFAKKDASQEDEREVRAEAANLNYIQLDGNIGCMVNGAGLAMATMDIIKLYGGEPANFLDVGGGVTVNQVIEAFNILTSDPKVLSIVVNIFGGIVRCDVIAQGIISAAEKLNVRVPIVCRLQGTRVDEAKALIAKSGLRIAATDNLDSAAENSVQIARVVAQARQAGLDVTVHMSTDDPVPAI